MTGLIFSQRGREGRMIRMLSDTKVMAKGTSYGIGIDENTALVVTHADTNISRGEVSDGIIYTIKKLIPTCE